jgi:PIN domain nuclease of toxin-antitoxin system
VIYLDTHVVIWLYEGLLDRFSDFAKQQIEENNVIISPMVQLELQYLFEIKRIKCASRIIIHELENKIGLEISQEPLQNIIQAALPFHWTRDPFDRLIVATAQISKAMLLTKDKMISSYYKHAIWD